MSGAMPRTPRRILYVGGYGRSGSTLLGRRLAAELGGSCLGEVAHLAVRSFRRDASCLCGKPFGECVAWQHAQLLPLETPASGLRWRPRLRQGFFVFVLPRRVRRVLVRASLFDGVSTVLASEAWRGLLDPLPSGPLVDVSKTTWRTAARPLILDDLGYDVQLVRPEAPTSSIVASRLNAAGRRRGRPAGIRRTALVLKTVAGILVAEWVCRRVARRLGVQERVIDPNAPQPERDDRSKASGWGDDHLIGGNRGRRLAVSDVRWQPAPSDLNRLDLAVVRLGDRIRRGAPREQDGSHPGELFIVGTGRSGTTIALEAFSQLPGCGAVPRVTGRVLRVLPLAGILQRLRLLPAAWGRPSPEASALFAGAGVTLDLSRERGGSIGLDDVPDGGARLRRNVRRARWWAGLDTLVIKSTAACTRIPLLADLFPTSRFVLIVRNPSDVGESLRRTDFWASLPLWWADGATPQELWARGHSPEVVAAAHWTFQTREAHESLSGLSAERWITIRYEDLVADPVVEVTKVAELIGAEAVSARELVGRVGLRGDRRRARSIPTEWVPALDDGFAIGATFTDLAGQFGYLEDHQPC